MPLHTRSPPLQNGRTTGAATEPDGILRFFQPSPGTESADPFQMHPWSMHQNSTAVSSAVGMGPGSGHGQTSPGLSAHVTLIYVTCDPIWPLFPGTLAEASPLASVHLFSGPKLSFTTSGTGWAGAVPVWSRVTDHKNQIRNKAKKKKQQGSYMNTWRHSVAENSKLHCSGMWEQSITLLVCILQTWQPLCKYANKSPLNSSSQIKRTAEPIRIWT